MPENRPAFTSSITVQRLALIVAVSLGAASASAGPITTSAFTSGGVQAWAAPFVPGDALSLNAPFGFEVGSFEWSYLYEETGCGENQIGWEGLDTPSVGVIFDFSAQPGAMTSLLLPMTTEVTNAVADNVWTSSDTGSPFTLFSDSTDTYYVAMETSCVEEAPGSTGEPSESSGAGGDSTGAPSAPAPPRVAYNRAVIRITIRPLPVILTTTTFTGTSEPPGTPETPGSSETPPAPVPEPATVLLVAFGLAARRLQSVRSARQRASNKPT